MEGRDRERRRTRSSQPTIEQARAFCAVAKAASYKEAAERLGLDEHLTLTRLVNRFTKALGHGKLIEPAGRGKIRLTPTGERVLPAAQGFVESAHDLMEFRPEIRFSAYPTIAGKLAARCPELLEQEVPLVLKNISEANRQDGGWRLVHDVLSGRLDMAIAPAGLGDGRLAERFLYKWRLVVVVPTDAKLRAGYEQMSAAKKKERRRLLKLRARTRVAPADIAGCRIAVAPHGHKSRELLRDAFAIAGLDLKVALESPNQELLRAVARGGTQYVAVMPDDSFGDEDDNLDEYHDIRRAPYLYVRNDTTRFGGAYALYMRRPEDLRSDRSIVNEHEAAIHAAAEVLVEAFSR